MMHAIGSDKFPAPQGTLMATLIKGLLSFNLDWQFVLVGVFLAITIELCGVKSLSFAVGALPAAVHHRADLRGRRHQGRLATGSRRRKGKAATDSELGPGNLFATGLVAGGAIAGVVVAILSANDKLAAAIAKLSVEHNLVGAIGQGGYEFLGVIAFAIMGTILYRISRKSDLESPRARASSRRCQRERAKMMAAEPTRQAARK